MRSMTAVTRAVAVTLTTAIALSGCATGPLRFPVEATRYHYDPVATRGTIVIEPVAGTSVSGIEFRDYAAAIQAELLRVGYTLPTAGGRADNLVTVAFTHSTRPLPSRRSPVTVGIGGGGFGGGVGIGGGASFPIGTRGAHTGVATEIQVRIRRGPDAIWEGIARSLTDLRARDADNASVARRLAEAMFSGFPGESGRTIEVK